MKHVTMMGAVWRMSDRNFKKLAKELKDSGGCVESMDAYGKEIVSRMYTISEIEAMDGGDGD
jgi:hypothetical protein